MNTSIDEFLFNHCQNMGYSRLLINQAWIDCQGNGELLLDTLFHLSNERYFAQKIKRAKYPKIKRILKSTLLKKLPRMHHLKLKFQGEKALEYLELRKLGLFSKKAFRNIKGISLEYLLESYGYNIPSLQKKHVSILADHINRHLRKLNHFSLTLRARFYGEGVSMTPLLESIKQSFVCLGSLKLSFRERFPISRLDLLSFERLFARISSSLKHLDLDFTENSQVNKDFGECLVMIIMNRLHKLEMLYLNFNSTNLSTEIVHLLINGASTHLTKLNSLNIRIESSFVTLKPWNLPIHNITNNLQNLILNFKSCRHLNLTYLWRLQDNIIALCPDLQQLSLSMQSNEKLLDEFYSAFEKGFWERLNLKRFKFVYANDFENTWNAYQEMQALELAQTMKMEEEVAKVKQWARGEEEVQLYYKTLLEEKQASEKDRYWLRKNEYLENNCENQFLEEEKMEEEGQDYLERLAGKFGEAVFGEQFWQEREKDERLVGPEGVYLEDYLEEEEMLREFKEKEEGF